MDFWRVIDAFPDYEINPSGDVRHRRRMDLKGTRHNQGGDLIIDLSRDAKKHTRKVSLLVAKAYLESPNPEIFNSVIHKDGDKSNCEVGNLEWRPRWFVIEYNQMFKHRPYNVSVEIEQTGEIFGTLREACVKYGLIEKRVYSSLSDGSRSFPHEFRMKQL